MKYINGVAVYDWQATSCVASSDQHQWATPWHVDGKTNEQWGAYLAPKRECVSCGAPNDGKLACSYCLTVR